MKHTEATKQKLSDMRRGERNPFFGRKHTPETRAKMAAKTRELNGSRQYAVSPQSVKLPTGQDLGYLAGLIDGEGSMGKHGSGSPFLTIYNTDPGVMEWLLSHVGGTVGGSPDVRGRTPCYAWRVQAYRDVQAVLSAVLPLLIAKQRDAVFTLDYVEKRHG